MCMHTYVGICVHIYKYACALVKLMKQVVRPGQCVCVHLPLFSLWFTKSQQTPNLLLPYTTLHNEGGKITVTAKMKRFFWYKYKQTKDEAWKRMALMKTGKVIKMPQRQFIGDGPDTQRIIREAIDRNLQKFNLSLTEFLRK